MTGRAEWQRTTLGTGLLLLAVLTPLPFGSVGPWAVLGFEALSAGLGALAIAIILREPGWLSGRVRLMLVPAAALVVIGAVQIVPLPDSLVRVIAPSTWAARAAVEKVVPEAAPRFATISLAPADTLDALLRFVACCLVALAASVAFRSRRELRRLAIALGLCGVFQAVYGSVEFLSGHQ